MVGSRVATTKAPVRTARGPAIHESGDTGMSVSSLIQWTLTPTAMSTERRRTATTIRRRPSHPLAGRSESSRSATTPTRIAPRRDTGSAGGGKTSVCIGELRQSSHLLKRSSEVSSSRVCAPDVAWSLRKCTTRANRQGALCGAPRLRTAPDRSAGPAGDRGLGQVAVPDVHVGRRRLDADAVPEARPPSRARHLRQVRTGLCAKFRFALLLAAVVTRTRVVPSMVTSGTRFDAKQDLAPGGQPVAAVQHVNELPEFGGSPLVNGARRGGNDGAACRGDRRGPG